MGEYKLIIRFDAEKRLSSDDRHLLKELVNEFLGEVRAIRVQVLHTKLLNITDGGKGE